MQVLKTERISSDIGDKSMERMLQSGTVTQGTPVNAIRYLAFPTAFGAAPQVYLQPMKGSVLLSRVPTSVAGSFSCTSKGTPLYSAKVFRWMAWGSV
jgi:hypothetical protein